MTINNIKNKPQFSAAHFKHAILQSASCLKQSLTAFLSARGHLKADVCATEKTKVSLINFV